jgi:hypothetical protein
MANFKVEKPQQDINLRKWGAGRVAQLRVVMGHLEQAVNGPLAAQVAQSPSRKFNQFIPKIVEQNITTQVAWREIRAQFSEPRGLRDFLFYEAQFGVTENFAQFEGFISPIPSFVFTQLIDNTTYYYRVRVVTKNGLVGPWSETQSGTTPFSQGFGLFDGTETIAAIAQDGWGAIFERTYTSIGGKAYYSIDYEATILKSFPVDANLEWADVELRWMVNDKQVGQNFLLTVYGTHNQQLAAIGDDMECITADIGSFDEVADDSSRDTLFIPGTFDFPQTGTFIQKFTTLDTDDNDYTFKLEGRRINWHPTPNDWQFLTAAAGAAASPPVTAGSLTEVEYGSNVIMKVKNFNVFETLVDG